MTREREAQIETLREQIKLLYEHRYESSAALYIIEALTLIVDLLDDPKRTEITGLRESGQVFQREAGRLCVERNELRAEIERLTEALEAIEHETGTTMLATNHGRRGDIANAIARAALEPKP